MFVTNKLKYYFVLISLFVITGVTFISCDSSKKVVLEWPEVTKTTRPWTRWWWMGNAVNEQDLLTLMKNYKNHGLGGLELTPIYGVKGHEDKFINYLSPKWMEMFQYTLQTAQRLNLGLDLDHTSSWPFGGPWVGLKNASKRVYYKTYQLEGGQKINKKIYYSQDPIVIAAGVDHNVSIGEIKQPIRANKNLQKLALIQVVFPQKLPLKALVAYSDDGKIEYLKGKVNAKGYLNWSAPPGNWTLYAVFEGWHGIMVQRASPGGEGFVIDPFSKKAVKDYLDHFAEAFQGHDISYLRSYFHDSYEVQEGRGNANWTPHFFAEFKRRQGYDLRDHLPALFGKSTKEKNARVIADYRQTISALLLHNFTITWRKWAHNHDAIIRNQAHGSPANILDLYAASDIPETESDDPTSIKFASSAAHVTGKPLISAEACTWMDEHFLGSLAEAKKSVNRFFLNGVNHIFYHGTTYSPPDARWPGWLFYAAVNFNQNNSFWDDFEALNTYVTRVQSFLQKGKPDNDILVYYPIFDYWSKPGSRLLKHFHGGGHGRQQSDFFRIADSLLNKGFTFDFVSDRQVMALSSTNGEISTDSLTYKTIILPKTHYIPLKTFKKIITLAKNGATIVVHHDLPNDVSGLGNLAQRRKQFKQLIKQIKFKPVKGNSYKAAQIGEGRMILGDNLQDLLAAAGVHRETMVDYGLQFVRRSHKNGTFYFIVNKGSKSLDMWVPIRRGGSSAAIFNPQTGEYGMAEVRHKEHSTQVYLQLKPGESRILNVLNKSIRVVNPSPYPYYKKIGKPWKIDGTWAISFIKGGPVLPLKVQTSNLTSWTKFETAGVKKFSGTARYTINFSKPKTQADAWHLNLGEVHESARVKLNGTYIDTLISAPYRITIPSDSLQSQNKLTVEVSNLMANRIAYMAEQDTHWKHFYNVNFPAKFAKNRNKKGLFDTSGWEPRPSGLVGPVTLTPLEKKNF